MTSSFQSEKLTLSGLPDIDFNNAFFKKEQKLSHVSHRYTVHEKESEIFAAKFSCD